MIGGNDGAIAKSGVRRSRQAEGCADSESSGADVAGVAGAERGNGMSLAIATSPAISNSSIAEDELHAPGPT